MATTTLADMQSAELADYQRRTTAAQALRAENREHLEHTLWALLRAGAIGDGPGTGAERMAHHIIGLIESNGIELDDHERRQLRWLAGFDVHTLAAIVTLIVPPELLALSNPLPTVPPSPDAQQRAAQRIVDMHPQLTMGQALGILAEALDALGVIEHG